MEELALTTRNNFQVAPNYGDLIREGSHVQKEAEAWLFVVFGPNFSGKKFENLNVTVGSMQLTWGPSSPPPPTYHPVSQCSRGVLI